MSDQLSELDAILGTLVDGVIRIADDGRIEGFNPAAERIFGYPASEVIGRNVSVLMPSPHREQHGDHLLRYLQTGESRVIGASREIEGRHKDGSLVPIDLSVSEARIAGRRVFTGFVRDLSERKLELQRALTESESRLRALTSSSPVGFFFTDRRGAFRSVNERFSDLSGLTLEAAQNDGWSSAIHPSDRERVRGKWNRVVREELAFRGEFRFRHSDGNDTWVLAQSAPHWNDRGEIIGHVGTVTDITEQMRARERIRSLAFYDALTGLPNRHLFKDRLSSAIHWARTTNRAVAVLLLDLDRFRQINDRFGRNIGDQLLQAVAQRLIRIVRLGDVVVRNSSRDPEGAIARLGGDEFTILLNELGDPQIAGRVAARLLAALSAPLELEVREVAAKVSIGIAVYPHDGDDAETLLHNADSAMHHAKGRGRGNFQFYTQSMNAAAARKLDLESQLDQALERGEFSLHYQPLRHATSGEVTAVEALARWENAERGRISPAEFIPLAEETGLILPIGEWVLRTAAAQAQAWQRAGFRPIRLSVNLSSQQLQHGDLPSLVERVLRDCSLSAAHLELEITESAIMQDDEKTATAFSALHDMGVGLALDDFGTGYSSLSSLRRFPLSRVKIDRSFVGGISTSEDNAALTSAIIAMAHSLNLKVVAEGVETQEQADFLCERGCHELQGFLFSRPVPTDEFSRFLVREKDT